MNIKRTTSWLVLLLLFVMVLPGGGSASVSAGASAVAQVPVTRLVANEVFAENLRFGGYFSADVWVDNAANKFTAYVRNGYEEPFQAAGVVRKVSPDGVLLQVWEILPSRQGKADDVDITPSGDDLLVTLTSHGGNGPRGVLGELVLEDVFAPYRVGEMPAGAPGVYAEGQGALAEVDYDRIKREVAVEVIQQLKQEMGGEIRAVLEQKAQDAIGKSFDPARYFTDPRARYAQDAALPWFRDRAYQGATSALANVGVCRGP